MTYPKQIITKVLHLRAVGLSLSSVRDYIWQHEGYKPCDKLILYWERKYSRLLKDFEKRLKPRVKGRIHNDEVVVKVKGKKHYSINAIDSKTKYVINQELTPTRSLVAFKRFFKAIKVRIYDQVMERYQKERHKPVKLRNLITFVSDGLGQYMRAFNKYFYHVAKLVHGVPIACKQYGLEHNNNPIERYNEDVKQRCKVMRGFKDFESTKWFLELRRIVRNFVRTHLGLGKTPAEEAGIKLRLGSNRLLDLIQIASGVLSGMIDIAYVTKF